MSFQQYNVYDGLMSCRVMATANQTGTYFNGPLNNGVGATFTYATGALTIDSVVVVQGDSVALIGQTNGWENGIYVCTQTGLVGVSAILQRRQDMQCIEQLKVGQWSTIGAGTVRAGSIFVVVEPLPGQFGIDALLLTAAIPAGLGTASTKAASDNTKGTVASVGSAVVIGSIAKFVDVSGTIDDTAGAASNTASTASATPGTIRSITGIMNGTNATMTSGNLVGVRGEVDAVGASGGFLYGSQGKVISTGTLSGSVWVAGLFGQVDVSAATINAGQVAALWGDWGATGAIATDMTGTSGIKFTNTTANVLHEQINTYGDATYYLNIRGNPGPLAYYLAAGTSAGSAGDASHCAAQQVLKIVVQGNAAYIPVFTQNS